MEKGKLTIYATHRISVWRYQKILLQEVCLASLGLKMLRMQIAETISSSIK